MSSSRLCPARLIDQDFGLCITPEDLILPFYNIHGSSYYRPWKWCINNAARDFGSTITNEKDAIKITLDVQHFLPNEVAVKVTDQDIIIEAKHEEKQDNHGFVSRQFTRRYKLPTDCSSETVCSTLSSDGILTVTARKKNNEAKDKVIPIKIINGACMKKESQQCKSEQEKACQKSEIKKGEDKSKAVMLMDEHSCLLKPELFKDAFSNTTETSVNIRKEKQDMMKASECMESKTKTMASELLEETFSGSKVIAEITEKIGESKMLAEETEITSMKASTSETTETKEISSSSTSFQSSMLSSIAASSERASVMLSEIISEELRQAAENN